MRCIFLITGLFFFIACAKKEASDTIQSQILLNIPYGSDSKQKMDIYLPAQHDTTTTKLLVLIHGGGWTEGDKTDFNPFITELQKRLPEYAVANINYRLATISENHFPTQENDVQAAIEFLITKSAEYKISKKVALLGASAGAHLALLHAYKHASPIRIKAAIDLFGPTELVSLYNSSPNPSIPLLLKMITEGTPVTHPLQYEQSSPFHFITKNSCPALLLHGGMDFLIPASQSELFRDKLFKNEVASEYIFYPTEGHGWVGINLMDTFNKIEAFLKKYM